MKHHSTRENRPGLEVIGQFTTCAAKSYWIALVLTGDEQKTSRIVASGIHEIADSGTVFGEWMCAWGIGVVINGVGEAFDVYDCLIEFDLVRKNVV